MELTVRDVLPLADPRVHAVMLVTADGETVLPVLVDSSAALAIAFRLAHRESPRPLSQDLLASVVDRLGGTVTQVRIDRVKAHAFEGRIFIQQGRRELKLDARPSDSLAIALGSKARILTTPRVLAEAALSREDLESVTGGGPGVGGSGSAGTSHAPLATPDVQL